VGGFDAYKNTRLDEMFGDVMGSGEM